MMKQLALVLTVIAAAANAQTTSDATQSSDAPVTMHSQSIEVMLDLVFRDKRGRLVRDIKREEVKVLDEGQLVDFASFRLVGGGEAESSAKTGGSGATSSLPDPLREIRLVSLLFEPMSLDPGRLAREAALDLVKEAAGRNVYFSVMVVRGKLRVLQPFTNDADLLKKAIDSVTGTTKNGTRTDFAAAEAKLASIGGSLGQGGQFMQGDTSALVPPNPGPGTNMAGYGAARTELALAQVLLTTINASEAIAREMQARPSVAALLALAREQGSLPGRKTIVYFSEGLQLTQSVQDQFDAVISASNRSNVSIYCVDATGLNATARNQQTATLIARSTQNNVNQLSGSSGGAVTTDQIKGVDTMLMGLSSNYQSPLNQLARKTGGFLITDSNDLRKPMGKIAEDISTWYEVSYAPKIDNFDGHFRKVTVEVTRPRVVVQGRSGYFALPPAVNKVANPHEAVLLKILSTQPLPRDLQYETNALRMRRDGNDQIGTVVFSIPTAGLQLEKGASPGVLSAKISAMVAAYDGSGKLVQKLFRDNDLEIPEERADAFRKQSVSLNTPFRLGPGKYNVDTLVMDRNSTHTGHTRTVLQIPASEGGPGLSQMVLVRRFEPAPGVAIQDPLRFQDTRIVPESTGVVPAGSPAAVFFNIFPVTSGKQEASSLEIEIKRDGEDLGRFPMTLPADLGASPNMAYVSSLPEKSLTPGDYEMRAIFKQAGKEATETIRFLVDGEKSSPALVAATTRALPASAVETPLKLLVSPEPILTASTAPGSAEQAQVLEAAKAYALNYGAMLPNFICLQLTHRYTDPTGREDWKPKDSLLEQLRYRDGHEDYSTLQINGKPSKLGSDELKGVTSSGEFGGLLKGLFAPESQTKFDWKGWAGENAQRQMVFTFAVPKATSFYRLRDRAGSKGVCTPGLHGLIYLDESTGRARRISVALDDIPRDFPVQESKLDVEFDNVRIGSEDFLLPSTATVRVRRGKRLLTRNEIRFREYRLYKTESSIQFDPVQ
jgi:VWFA-related protein